MESDGRSQTAFRRQSLPRQSRRRSQDQGRIPSCQTRLHNSLGLQMYYKELTIWRQLNHQNVVPTFGASTDIAEFCVVAPWMPEGDLSRYLREYPGANRVEIVRTSSLILASECTECRVQDAWGGRWPFLPPLQRRRSWGCERGQSGSPGCLHPLTHLPSAKHSF